MDEIKEAVNGSCQQGLKPDIFAENEGKVQALSPEGVQQGTAYRRTQANSSQRLISTTLQRGKIKKKIDT